MDKHTGVSPSLTMSCKCTDTVQTHIDVWMTDVGFGGTPDAMRAPGGLADSTVSAIVCSSHSLPHPSSRLCHAESARGRAATRFQLEDPIAASTVSMPCRTFASSDRLASLGST